MARGSLTIRQKRFCEEYHRSGNATKAAILAGYSEKTAYSIGCENLTKPEICDYIDQLKYEFKDSKTVEINPVLKSQLLELFGGKIDRVHDAIEIMIAEYLYESEARTRLLSLRSRYVNQSTRYQAFKKSGFRCDACGAAPLGNNSTTLHVDHIVPFSLGGGNELSNLQTLCSRCNQSKGNRCSLNIKEVKLMGHGKEKSSKN